jgi:hypothetical protein
MWVSRGIMAEDSRFDSVIDDDGQLFGVVNVIDTLVVLVLVAVVVAGVALVSGGSGGTADQRYVTVDLGPQPTYVAEQVTAGDEWTPSGGGTFTITDTYKYNSQADEGGTAVVVRAVVNGTETDTSEEDDEPSFEFGGETLRFGRELEIETSEYAVEGPVTAIRQSGAAIETQRREFVVQTTVTETTAATIQQGDTYAVGNESLLRVESVRIYHTAERETRRVILGVSALTRTAGGRVLFGEQPVQRGGSLSIQTNGYQLSGQIIRRGGTVPPGSPVTRTVTVQIDDASPTTANALSTGLVEQIRSTQTAEVTNLQVEPAERVVQSGDSFTTVEFPERRNVTMSVEVSLRELPDGTLQFRSSTLTIDEEIVLDFGSIRVSGRVTSIESG